MRACPLSYNSGFSFMSHHVGGKTSGGSVISRVFARGKITYFLASRARMRIREFDSQYAPIIDSGSPGGKGYGHITHTTVLVIQRQHCSNSGLNCVRDPAWVYCRVVMMTGLTRDGAAEPVLRDHCQARTGTGKYSLSLFS